METKGLEGVAAATTELSTIDGQKGELVYRGYNINELAGKASFEEVAYLLWNGELPTRAQYTKLCEQISTEMGLPMSMMGIMFASRSGSRSNRAKPDDFVLRFQFPKTSGPMQSLRTAVSALALHDQD